MRTDKKTLVEATKIGLSVVNLLVNLYRLFISHWH